MEMKKKKTRRSDTKIMTKEARILKVMRESRKLSMRRAGGLLGASDALISHAENGRLDLTPQLIMRIISIYGYSYDDFLKFKMGDIELPEAVRTECIEIIKRLSFEKLKTVKTILQSF
jgi:transcriptional regulator with XRE-family HTH domain